MPAQDPGLIDQDIRTPGRLARTLRDHRRSIGRTQADIASRAGVSVQWLSGFENGRGSCGTHRMMRLLDALDLSLAVHQRTQTLADTVLESTSVPLRA